MRRRGPPSSLRLFQGPLPPRSHPKHTLPSFPRPVFRPEASVSVPRTRHANPDYQIPFSLELATICRPDVPSKRVRGPWDDASCFDIVVDVESVLAVPKPVCKMY